jgi:hypothetical protein
VAAELKKRDVTNVTTGKSANKALSTFYAIFTDPGEGMWEFAKYYKETMHADVMRTALADAKTYDEAKTGLQSLSL